MSGKAASALSGGIAAHAMLPLHHAATSAFALVLATAGHFFGWPVAQDGSQAITWALVACLTKLEGQLVLSYPVRTMDDLPPARTCVFDVLPKQLVAIAGAELPSLHRKRLTRFRYGPGVFKMVCSSPTPPGGGLHGMCGCWAARSVLRPVFQHTQRQPAPTRAGEWPTAWAGTWRH